MSQNHKITRRKSNKTKMRYAQRTLALGQRFDLQSWDNEVPRWVPGAVAKVAF